MEGWVNHIVVHCMLDAIFITLIIVNVINATNYYYFISIVAMQMKCMVVEFVRVMLLVFELPLFEQ